MRERAINHRDEGRFLRRTSFLILLSAALGMLALLMLLHSWMQDRCRIQNLPVDLEWVGGLVIYSGLIFIVQDLLIRRFLHRYSERTKQFSRRLGARRRILLSSLRSRNEELENTNLMLKLENARRKAAELELRNRDTELKAILNNSSALITLKDSEGGYILANHAFETLTGIQGHSLVGRTDEQIFGPSESALIRKNDRAVIEQNCSIKYQEELTVGDRRRTYLTVRFPLLDEKQEPWAVGSISTDISEYVETRHAMERSYEFLERAMNTLNMVLDSLDAGIYSAEAETGRIIFVNRYLRERFGEVMGKRIQEIFPEPSSKTGSEAKAIFRIQASGEWFERRETEINWLEGERVLLGILTEVSERKRAEEDLFEQIYFLRVLMDTIPNPLFYTDYNGIFLGCNLTFEQTMGLIKKSIIGRPVEEFAQMQTLELSREENRLLYDEGAILQLETLLRFADGKDHNIIAYKAPFYNKDGSPRGLVGLLVDVTDRKTFEMALRESEERLKATITSMTDLIYVLDEKGIFREYYPPERLSNLYDPPESLLRLPYDRYFPEEAIRILGKAIDLKKIDDPAKDMEYAMDQRGRTRIFNARISIRYNARGLFDGITLVSRDVTDQRAAEEQLESARRQLVQSEKLASLGQLTGGIAHEINNPINFIYSALPSLKKNIHRIIEILQNVEQMEERSHNGNSTIKAALLEIKKEHKYEKTVANVENLLEIITEGTARTARIVHDMLNFARSGTEHFEATDINDCIGSALNLLYNSYKKRIEIIREATGDQTVECNAGLINQLIMNLLTNAVQSIENEGKIHIRTYPKGDDFFVEIEDTGSGVAPENMTRIFEPFFTTKPSGHGTGLGLSLSYDIIKKHNGTIQVQSEKGKGSTFTVRLPRRARKEEVSP